MKASRWPSSLSALVLVLASGPAAGQAKGSNDMAERVNRPVVYQVEGMDRVRVRKDLVYKKDGAVDPERVALAAYSAGGPLLAAPIREPKPYVRCLVAFYSFLDLRPSALHRKFLSEEQVRQF